MEDKIPEISEDVFGGGGAANQKDVRRWIGLARREGVISGIQIAIDLLLSIDETLVISKDIETLKVILMEEQEKRR
jgi:hypothetical protein